MTKEKDGELANLKTIIKSNNDELKNKETILNNKIDELKKQLNIFQQQPDSVYKLMKLYASDHFTSKPLQQQLLESMISNANHKNKQYSSLTKDFWIDCYNKLSHTQFDKIAENFNGPWRATVCRWRGKGESCTFGINYNKVQEIAVRKSDFVVEQSTNVNTSLNELNVESFLWASRDNVKKIQDSTPFNCMIDETATKIVIEFNPTDFKLYGCSAMPRFVTVRNIDENFNVENYFSLLKIQLSRQGKRVCGVEHITVRDNSYYFAYAQFETYSGWLTALGMNGDNDYEITSIEQFPSIDQQNSQYEIDKVFKESESMDRPRSTCVYSLVVNETTNSSPIEEVAVISTNNKYLQNQDHKLYTYSLIKLFNRCHIPVLQFAGDGDARFRNHMLVMSAYTTNNVPIKLSDNDLVQRLSSIKAIGIEGGWNISTLSLFDAFHFYFQSKELSRPTVASYLPNEPAKPYFPDISTKVSYYLGLRCCTDVFVSLAPIMGGLPRSPCQDQCHWLRKLLKTSLLSTKPLLLGNYVALFTPFYLTYQKGPACGLISRDLDLHNKTEQKSSERMINDNCLKLLKSVPWSAGIMFFTMLGKRAFEAWWKVDMTIVERMSASYYVLKSLHNWKSWLEKRKKNLKECFITLELYRDSIIMCSSLIHVAITFKLFYSHLPFLPWEWSEYPLESYYSNVRFLHGHDDEFSALEYMHRSKTMVSTKVIAAKGTVPSIRKKNHQHDWSHPKNPSKEKYPKLFSHEWSLSQLLNLFHLEDLHIYKEFKNLGMLNTVKVVTPTSRKNNCQKFLGDISDEFKNLLLSPLLANEPELVNQNEEEEVEENLDNIEPIVQTHGGTAKRKLPKLIVDDKNITISKYVTLYKQRGDRKSSGSRNIHRFKLADNETHVTEEGSLSPGDFFISKKGILYEILQLRRGKTLLFNSKVTHKLSFIGVKYRLKDKNVYVANPKCISGKYQLIVKLFKTKVSVIDRWTAIGDEHFVKLSNVEIESDITEEEEEEEEALESEKFCFCREEKDDIMFIQCSKQTCRIQWYHISCVGLTEKTIPENKWICPRCSEDCDTFCICGENSGKFFVNLYRK